MSHRKMRACAAQIAPVFLDRKATVEKYAEVILEAGRRGVDLIVTPETGIAGYPYWRNNFGYADPGSAQHWKDTVIAFYEAAIRIPGPETEALGRAIGEAGLTAVIGVNERDDRPGSRTVYNTMLFFDADGDILGRHRKLMPTHQERIFWGRGGANDLQVFETPFGTLGGLICFENHMTLLKAAMAVKGEAVHAACWPGYWTYGGPGNTVRDMTGKVDALHASDQDAAVREYAFETQTFVVSASMYMPEDAVPDDFPFKKSTNWKWAMGGSAIATPFGTYAAEPMFGKEGLVIADLDLDDRTVAKNVFDCMGHYSRWDVASLRLSREHPGPEGPGMEDSIRGMADPRQAIAAALRAGAVAAGPVPPGLVRPLLAAIAERGGGPPGGGGGGTIAARAELDSDDLDELARSHGLSHDEIISLLHDFIDLIRKRSGIMLPDFETDPPADA